MNSTKTGINIAKDSISVFPNHKFALLMQTKYRYIESIKNRAYGFFQIDH